jgi:hypothetical protein
MVPRDGQIKLLEELQEQVADKDTSHQLEETNLATFSTDHHHKLPNKKPVLLTTPVVNNFWTISEKDLPREVPEVLHLLEGNSRLLMTTDLDNSINKSSPSACTISESE